MTLNDHDSGYPSDTSFKIRVDSHTVYVPNYFPHPKINHLANEIFSLEARRRNTIVGKYLLNMKFPQLAKHEGCTVRTIYRRFNEARGILLDRMSQFSYKNTRV